MDLTFRYGGSTSFKTASRLAEVWRDLQLVGQAATLAPEWYPIGGRAFLGLDRGQSRVVRGENGAIRIESP
jgi:indole-3-acetate monooxygenase